MLFPVFCSRIKKDNGLFRWLLHLTKQSEIPGDLTDQITRSRSRRRSKHRSRSGSYRRSRSRSTSRPKRNHRHENGERDHRR
ncbi:unnamed protein product [Rotaria magnacalcarata]